jgi:hypothetical protein
MKDMDEKYLHRKIF